MVKNLKNLIIVIIVVAGISTAGYFLYQGNKGDKGSTQINLLSSQEAAEKAINFINQNLLSEEVTASLIEVVEESDLYRFKLKVEDQEHTSYVSKDGKLFFIEGFDMDEKPETLQSETPAQ